MDAEFDCIFRALLKRAPGITMDEIKNTFANWEFIRLTRDENLVGVALRKNAELHLIIDPIYQNTIVFLQQCRNIVDETVNKYGYAETKVINSYEVGHRLAKILGFKEIDSASAVTHYKKEV